jgi:hypothetical protein
MRKNPLEGIKIIVKAHIRRVDDGVTRVHEDDWTKGHEEWLVDADKYNRGPGPQNVVEALERIRYWWTDGNGSCDCNKGLFFDRLGEDEDEDESTDWLAAPCTDDLFVLDRLAAYVDTAGIVEEFEIDVEPI